MTGPNLNTMRTKESLLRAVPGNHRLL